MAAASQWRSIQHAAARRAPRHNQGGSGRTIWRPDRGSGDGPRAWEIRGPLATSEANSPAPSQGRRRIQPNSRMTAEHRRRPVRPKPATTNAIRRPTPPSAAASHDSRHSFQSNAANGESAIRAHAHLSLLRAVSDTTIRRVENSNAGTPRTCIRQPPGLGQSLRPVSS